MKKNTGCAAICLSSNASAWCLGMLVLIFSTPVAAADRDWLTIIGDAADPAMTTIAVSPTSIRVQGMQRVMKIRVNRAGPRNADGVPHRSYEAQALVECEAPSARFISKTFFLQPLWGGPAIKTVTYGKGEVVALRFGDVEPDPAPRLIRAACNTQVMQSQ